MRARMTLHECIDHCWKCRHTCQEVLFAEHATPLEPEHLKIMVDCIQICQTAADFMTRESSRHTAVCAACAQVCEACAEACEQSGNEAMQASAYAARRCAESCREMSALHEAA